MQIRHTCNCPPATRSIIIRLLQWLSDRIDSHCSSLVRVLLCVPFFNFAIFIYFERFYFFQIDIILVRFSITIICNHKWCKNYLFYYRIKKKQLKLCKNLLFYSIFCYFVFASKYENNNYTWLIMVNAKQVIKWNERMVRCSATVKWWQNEERMNKLQGNRNDRRWKRVNSVKLRKRVVKNEIKSS